ncbi:MAG TPA: hypothetical protein VK838_05655, partial [Candidatus Limnocylindrales bacterium]|nr:hypothetical protein [Candidatus Limnocylindrales bacterium]
MSTSPDVTAVLRPGFRLDLGRTLAPLAHGRGDPTIRLARGEAWRASRTPEGPATLRVALADDRIELAAWGAGAGWAVASARGLIGLDDDPDRLEPRHRLIDELARRFAGLRLPRSGLPFEALLPAICEQKVTGDEARRAYRAIVRRYGE